MTNWTLTRQGQALKIEELKPDKPLIRMGRSPENDIYCLAKSISRRHVEIHKYKKEYKYKRIHWRLKDPGSLGRVYVNGVAIPHQKLTLLNDNDLICLGGNHSLDDAMGPNGDRIFLYRVRAPQIWQKYDESTRDQEGSDQESAHSRNETEEESDPFEIMEESDLARKKSVYNEINITNVFCHFDVGCQLDLLNIATKAINVDYSKGGHQLLMMLRNPCSTAVIRRSGKITSCGTRSEEQAKTAARKFARQLQKLDSNVQFKNFRVSNVTASLRLPFRINETSFAKTHLDQTSHEPEISSGVDFKCKEPKANLKIFHTGAIIVTGAGSVTDVRKAVERVYPLVEKFKKKPKRKRRVSEQQDLNWNPHCSEDV